MSNTTKPPKLNSKTILIYNDSIIKLKTKHDYKIKQSTINSFQETETPIQTGYIETYKYNLYLYQKEFFVIINNSYVFQTALLNPHKKLTPKSK